MRKSNLWIYALFFCPKTGGKFEWNKQIRF